MKDQTKRQFDFEVAGAKAIMNAGAEDRPSVYAEVYDGFYSQFGAEPHGVQNAQSTRSQLAFIRHFVKSQDITFVEFGPGLCSLLLEMAKRVNQVIGIEASAVATSVQNAPANFKMIVAPRGKWDLSDNSVDVVYSNQVLEHLHPDDCREVLNEALRVLKPSGLLLALTPSQISGPHDISRSAPDEPTFPRAVGLHLIEYDHVSLTSMVRTAGFDRISVFIGSNSTSVIAPVWVGMVLDRLLTFAPRNLRIGKIGRGLTGIRMAALKPSDVDH